MARKLKDIGKYKRTSVKGEVYQASTGTTYKKVAPGKWEMIPDTEVLKWLKQAERRITSRRNKGPYKGVKFKRELDYLRHARKEYLQAVKDFNSGKITRPITVARREKRLTDKALEYQKVFSRENREELIKTTQIKNKIAYSRMLGRDNVYNDKLYDQVIADTMKTLGVDREEATELLFPSGFEERSEYEEFKKNKKENKATIFDRLNERVSSGAISSLDKANYVERWNLS